jgi:hypothetical protein
MVRFVDLREGLDWFDTHLKGRPARLRDKPVRVYLMGADEWRDLEMWPPPSQEKMLYLQSDDSLSESLPEIEACTRRYSYDPSNPTPAVGGTMFSPIGAGAQDNRNLEARADVLTFTTAPLSHAMEVIGCVRLQLYVRSSLEYTDFFGRLCDVRPDGRSTNICDGLFRITPQDISVLPDGSTCIEIDMWATAYRFQPGHALRLQVSSGAHPRWMRNLGTGEPLVSGAIPKIADQTVYLDRHHPSVLMLPVVHG